MFNFWLLFCPIGPILLFIYYYFRAPVIIPSYHYDGITTFIKNITNVFKHFYGNRKSTFLMPLDVKSFPCVNKNKGMNHLPTYLSIFEGDNEVIGLRFDAKLSVRLSSHPIFKRGRNIFRRRHSCRPTLLPCRQIVVVIFVIIPNCFATKLFYFLERWRVY